MFLNNDIGNPAKCIRS